MINVNYNLSKIIIRPMELDDLEEVLNIEKKSFPNPWTYNIFYYELTQNKYAKYFVLEKNKEIIGYLGLWYKGRSFHISNIAINERWRKRGYGGSFLKFIEKIASKHKIKDVSLEVRRSNLIAQNMYRKYGYKVIRIRKNYYQDEKEDALVMKKKLN